MVMEGGDEEPQLCTATFHTTPKTRIQELYMITSEKKSFPQELQA